jgi:hypothetical protein
MAQINTFNDISSYVNNILEDSLLIARANAAMPALVQNFSAVGENPRKVYQYGTVTINAIGESDDMTSQAFTPSLLSTLTPAEAGAQYFLTDRRIASDWSAVRADASNDLGLAMAEKVDVDLVSLFSSLTGGTVGNAGTNLTWANIFSAKTLLKNKFAPLPYFCVLHPNQTHCLGTVVAPGVTVTNSPMIQDAFMRQFFVANVAGIDIYEDANITSGTSTFGAMFSRPAIALDTRRAARIEYERDASRRGFELNATMIYAKGTWRPTWGVAINTAGTAPV